MARFNAYRSRFGVPLVGPDGFWREANAEWREEVGALGGKSLRTLMGPALSEAMEQELRGQGHRFVPRLPAVRRHTS